ncbi:MAG: hypothetical protein MH321_01110 [Leptospiraceae bacterium]|nr:hypothetical protein [Leptospiraceae bacterium]
MLAKYALNDSTSHCGISLRLNGNPNSLPSSPKSLATMPAATHTLFKFEDERIKAWGFGSDGQLGYGNTNNIGDGVPPNLSIKDSDFIPIADSVKQLTAGSNFSCALLRTGDVKCWGNGALGKLGYNSILDVGDGIGQSILQAGDLVLE